MHLSLRNAPRLPKKELVSSAIYLAAANYLTTRTRGLAPPIGEIDDTRLPELISVLLDDGFNFDELVSAGMLAITVSRYSGLESGCSTQAIIDWDGYPCGIAITKEGKHVAPFAHRVDLVDDRKKMKPHLLILDHVDYPTRMLSAALAKVDNNAFQNGEPPRDRISTLHKIVSVLDGKFTPHRIVLAGSDPLLPMMTQLAAATIQRFPHAEVATQQAIGAFQATDATRPAIEVAVEGYLRHSRTQGHTLAETYASAISPLQGLPTEAQTMGARYISTMLGGQLDTAPRAIQIMNAIAPTGPTEWRAFVECVEGLVSNDPTDPAAGLAATASAASDPSVPPKLERQPEIKQPQGRNPGDASSRTQEPDNR